MNDWSEKSKQKLKLCVDEIIYLIEERKSSINNRQLINIWKEFVDTFAAEVDPHIYHEIAETTLNLLIKNKYARDLLQSAEPDICVKWSPEAANRKAADAKLEKQRTNYQAAIFDAPTDRIFHFILVEF
jgi:hypothetical protein